MTTSLLRMNQTPRAIVYDDSYGDIVEFARSCERVICLPQNFRLLSETAKERMQSRLHAIPPITSKWLIKRYGDMPAVFDRMASERRISRAEQLGLLGVFGFDSLEAPDYRSKAVIHLRQLAVNAIRVVPDAKSRVPFELGITGIHAVTVYPHDETPLEEAGYGFARLLVGLDPEERSLLYASTGFVVDALQPTPESR